LSAINDHCPSRKFPQTVDVYTPFPAPSSF
jgi:hypothetical protein